MSKAAKTIRKIAGDAPIVAALSDRPAMTKRARPFRATRPSRRSMPCPGEK